MMKACEKVWSVLPRDEPQFFGTENTRCAVPSKTAGFFRFCS